MVPGSRPTGAAERTTRALTSFVGRRLELGEGRRLLEQTRLLTLTGPGGVGKTRLALELARATTRAFADVYLIELQELGDPDALAQLVASVLGVEDRGRTELESIAAYLQPRRALLVLDNCEHLVDACSHLLTVLLTGAPSLRVIATTREPLRVPGEQLMVVGPLGVPPADEHAVTTLASYDSVNLLVERARLVEPGFGLDPENARLVAQLCTLVEGIPLAVELAAARLRMLSLDQLVERLGQSLSVLSGGGRTVPARHQTVVATVEWSFRLCSPAEQRLWALMSVFEGSADLDAAEAVCAEPGASVFDAVAGLVDKSVLMPQEVAGRVRYRMLETVRDFGRARLRELGDVANARNRHRDHFVALARYARATWFGPDQRDWLARLRADQENLRVALDHALSDPETIEQALEVTSSLYWYWPAIGAMQEGMRWTRRALAVPTPASPIGLRALDDAAHQAGMMSDLAGVTTYAARALALDIADQTAGVRADRLRARAHLCEARYDNESALAPHQQALRECQKTGDVYRQVEHLESLGGDSAIVGNLHEAVAFAEQAVAICEAHGEENERSELLWFLGEQMLLLGRYADALARVQECLAVAPGLNARGVARALAISARIHAATGEGRRAAVLLGASTGLVVTMGGGAAPNTEGHLAECERQARAAVGDRAFEDAYDEGCRMTMDEAVAFALGTSATRDTESRPTPRRHAETGVELSPRERQVAELVARGQSNKEIAATLVISPRTAEGHVARIMDRLGFGSRAQVAAWVAEQRASGD